MRLRNILLCGLLFAGCEGSLLQCSSEGSTPNLQGTWLGATVTLTRFNEESARSVPANWESISTALQSQPGFQRNKLYAGTNAVYPYVNLGVWDSTPQAERAHAALEVPEGTAPIVGHYEMVEHRGDVRESGDCIAIIPIEDDGEDQAEQFRMATEWFGQKAGFVGSVLLRRTAGDGAAYTIITRWTSREALQAVTADGDLPLHISGGTLGIYTPAS